VIGDSTFWHSGLSGLANAIWKNADILVVIVDNSYTAMTGGQPNPSSHYQALDIANVVRAMGAEVFEINPMDFKESRRVIKEAANLSGVRVIVSTYPCVLRKDTQDSTLLQTKLIVEQDKCNGCSQCQDLLGCPAIAMVDNLAAIDNSLCTKCGLCIQVCRRDAIVRLS
jgi:indolepyruvate ferredoxin oxidoreductase alpha subunit